MSSNTTEEIKSNIVSFCEKQISDYTEFEVKDNVIYRVKSEFQCRDIDFLNEHCDYLDVEIVNEANGQKLYTFKPGELYFYVEIEYSDVLTKKELIPVTTPINTIIKDDDFKESVEELVKKITNDSALVTRNQLRIRSNNIQAWVVNNFIAKNAKGDGSNIPGTVKVSDRDGKADYLENKLISSDDSIKIETIGYENEGQKIDIRTDVRGIAFAEVTLTESDWVEETVGEVTTYYIDLSNNASILNVINGTDPKRYRWIKGADVYLIDNDIPIGEFSVNKVYGDVDVTNPVTGDTKRYTFLKYLRSNHAHDIKLVLYLTNGTIPKDSGGEPLNYLVRAVVDSEDPNKLTLVPNQGSPIEFNPNGGAKSLSDLTDFTGEQGVADLGMLQSLLEVTRSDYVDPS